MQSERFVLALGMFDGVHAGHRALLNHAVSLAAERGIKSMVYTFSNHPRSVFMGVAPKLLMNAEERRQAMLSLGIEDVDMELFTREVAALSPDAYISRLLARGKVSGIVVGFNYSFGMGGQGNADTLHRLGASHQFTVDVIPPVLHEGQSVSSTRIREAIERGEIKDANAMLCAPYSISGPVVENRHIGQSIGFPTANILPDAEKALPLAGVYASYVELDGALYPAVTNVGNNPTVEGKFTTVESHLLGFAGNLYGKLIRVQFRNFIRKEHKFPDKEALAAQIASDRDAAVRLLGANMP